MIESLTTCGYQVTAVENGIQARNELLNKDSTFDIILLDIMMPKMDGLEVLKLIKENPSLADIPVVMMSSDNSQFVVA